MPANRLLLLVEDNPDDEEVTLRGLRKAHLNDCEVEVMRDGQEVLDRLLGEGSYATANRATRQPDLILLDLSLPRVPGLEVLKRIRSDERLTLVPVVILSSSMEQTDRIRGYMTGANSYVQKPVEYTAFLEAVRHLGIYWMRWNQTA